MELFATPDFREWLTARGIFDDARYPGTGSLMFETAPSCWCPWESPAKTEEVIPFVRNLFHTAENDAAWYIYPRHSIWPSGEGEQPTPLESLCRDSGVAPGFEGAIQFRAGEFDDVLALAVTALEYAETVWEDFYFIPSSGSVLLMTSHHEEIIVIAPSQQSLNRFAHDLRTVGIPHPDDEVEEAE